LIKYFLYIIFFNLIISQVHFSDLPDNTGVSHMIIIQNIIGLDIGDEVGLFDSNGLLSNGDCSNEYGEILVGAAIYNGEQISPVGVGSIDFCSFPDGYQLPGFIGGNSIVIKVWDASEDIEYVPEVIYNSGSENWGFNDSNFSVIDLIVNELSVNIINEFSMINIYPNPFNALVTFDFNESINEDLNISIFNVSGQKVDSFEFKSLNNKSIIWDASSYNSGIYFVKFKNSKFSLTKKVSLLK